PRKNLDNDPPSATWKFPNECDTPFDQPVARPWNGLPFCTERNEPGCSSDSAHDEVVLRQRRGHTARVIWDWLSQDYPHDPKLQGGLATVVYNPILTSSARVRVRVVSNPVSPIMDNATPPQTLLPYVYGTLGRPLYDGPRWRWIWPLGFRGVDPLPPILAPVSPTTPVDALPSFLDWNVDGYSTTRALVAATPTASQGVFGGLLPSRFMGEGTHPGTIAFGAAQLYNITLIFGGDNGERGLSSDLWFGYPEGGEFFWQALDTGGVRGTQTGAEPVSKRSNLLSFSKWVASHQKTLGLSRRSLLNGLASISSKASTLRQPASRSTALPGQRDALLLPNPWQLTLTVLFGDTGSSSSAGEPTRIAVYDLLNAEWITAEAAWRCGARQAVGAAMDQGAGDSFYFYGGSQDGVPVAGLFRQTLQPELLLSGQDVVALDENQVFTPGPRKFAAMVHDTVSGNVYLFGGQTQEGVVSDLWRFSLADGLWTRLSDGSDLEAPPAMIAAGLFVSPVDGAIYVIGGTSTSEKERIWRYRYGRWAQVTRWGS
ncbi:MAG: hypothetical protein KAI47_28010, partial [Deltaproteobacteria bacterium]|nr:hypothetical protein [Deltaproteobacteria bacterium]